MGDLIPAGLARRSAERIFDAETAEEIGAMTEEAQEGADEADAMIELELGDAYLEGDDDIELEGDDDILEDEAEANGGEVDDGTGDEDDGITDAEENEILTTWTGTEGDGKGDLTESALAGEALII